MLTSHAWGQERIVRTPLFDFHAVLLRFNRHSNRLQKCNRAHERTGAQFTLITRGARRKESSEANLRARFSTNGFLNERAGEGQRRRSEHLFHILPACTARIANARSIRRIPHHFDFAAAFGIHATISFVFLHGHDFVPATPAR